MDRYDQGVNEVADPTDLAPGETTACAGIWYRSGDKRAHLINPSSAFSSAASSVQDMVFLPFDNGPDALVVRANDSIYAENVAATSPTLATANISSALTSLSGDRMVASHYADQWYLALGSGQTPQVLSSTGSLPLASKAWGLRAPTEAMTATLGTGSATLYRPASTDSSTGWVNPGNACNTIVARKVMSPFDLENGHLENGHLENGDFENGVDRQRDAHVRRHRATISDARVRQSTPKSLALHRYINDNFGHVDCGGPSVPVHNAPSNETTDRTWAGR